MRIFISSFVSTSRNAYGFTLIELIVTLTILMIVASMAIIAWPGDIINMRATAESLVSDIRYTQILSMTTHERYRLNFTDTAQYQILTNNGTAIMIPAVNSTAVILPTGVTLTSSVNYLVFDSRGTPYASSTASGNGAALIATLTMTLTGTQSTMQINITPETGRVYIS